MSSLELLVGGDPRRLRGSLIAVLGSGGKTSLLAWLARELSAHHPRVLLSTLTKVYPFPGVECVDDPEALPAAFERDRVVFLGRQVGVEGKRAGLPELKAADLPGLADLVLLENDGARGHPLKVHLPHDPPVPERADLALFVAGAAALGQRPREEILHRAERAPAHWGLDAAAPLNTESICRILLAPDGYLGKAAGVPSRFLINQADAFPAAAQELAAELARRWPGPILYGSARAGRWHALDNPGPRISLAVLAAGSSRRFGADKRLAAIEGRPLLEWTLTAYAPLRALEKLVVLRPEDAELAARAVALGFRPVHCTGASEGMSASLKAALAATNPAAEGLLLALGDMPGVGADTLARMLERIRLDTATPLRPRHEGAPGHPVYIPRTAFDAMTRLSGDRGPRAIMPELGCADLDISDAGVVQGMDRREDRASLAKLLARRSGT